MGYTHYFEISKAPIGQAHHMERVYKRAIKDCNAIIRHYSKVFDGGLAGFSAHVKAGLYGGLNVNGSTRVGACEPFIMPEHFNQNKELGFQFCKTDRHPYDTIVTACLILLKHRLGDCMTVTSDGNRENWNDGLTLVKQALNIERINIPDTIKRSDK